jgi:DNA repair ATPase RecN
MAAEGAVVGVEKHADKVERLAKAYAESYRNWIELGDQITIAEQGLTDATTKLQRLKSESETIRGQWVAMGEQIKEAVGS